MARYGRTLTDAQWEKIRPLLPKRPKRPQGGRPPKDDRKVLEGILWILRSGARWCDLPDEFPSPTTCWRRLRDWEEQGVWLTIWRAFLAAVSLRRKKGLESRKNQAGQGDEVDGGGRRRGSSSGKAALLCVPERSPARGRNACVGPRKPTTSPRATPRESTAGHCRSRF